MLKCERSMLPMSVGMAVRADSRHYRASPSIWRSSKTVTIFLNFRIHGMRRLKIGPGELRQRGAEVET